jgi:tRNA G10  N-methylase Trm11
MAGASNSYRVYDPFAGTGTTLWVAEKEFGCEAIGTEIDPDYADFIHERMK